MSEQTELDAARLEAKREAMVEWGGCRNYPPCSPPFDRTNATWPNYPCAYHRELVRLDNLIAVARATPSPGLDADVLAAMIRNTVCYYPTEADDADCAERFADDDDRSRWCIACKNDAALDAMGASHAVATPSPDADVVGELVEAADFVWKRLVSPGSTVDLSPWGERFKKALAQAAAYAATGSSVVGEVLAERARQDAKWGEQNHPDGTDVRAEGLAVQARAICQRAAEGGRVTWAHILNEEMAEAFAETDPTKLRAELIQVAAVAVAWIECIDRRHAATGEEG